MRKVSEKVKRTIALFTIVLLLLPLAGCGLRQKAADKMAEKVTEGILGKVAGENVDVDLKDGKVSVKDGDGTEWTMGGGEWPKKGPGTLIPQFKKGKIASVIDTPEGFWITLEGVNEADFTQYMETLKKAGFDKDVSTFNTEENVSYAARKEGTATVMVNYTQDKTMAITLSLEEDE